VNGELNEGEMICWDCFYNSSCFYVDVTEYAKLQLTHYGIVTNHIHELCFSSLM